VLCLLLHSFLSTSCTLAWAVWSDQRVIQPFLLSYPAYNFCLGLLPSIKGFNINKIWKTLQFHSATPFVSFFPFLLSHVGLGRMIWSAYILSILVFSCSAHYHFAWGWIFLDLWVSSSALLLDCMCFFDFMFPFQVTALYLTRDAALSSTSCGRNHKLLKRNCQLELGWYFRHFVSNSFTIQSIHSLLYWKVQQSLESSIMFWSSYILRWNKWYMKR